MRLYAAHKEGGPRCLLSSGCTSAKRKREAVGRFAFRAGSCRAKESELTPWVLSLPSEEGSRAPARLGRCALQGQSRARYC